ncbi:MAG: hypothetical protein ACREGE_00695 [Candidatus Microsaccharimonas sp.]
MISLILVALSTLLREVSDSVGKTRVQAKKQGIYTSVFLSTLVGGLIMFVLIFAGAPFVFQVESLPYFIPRMILELLEAYLVIVAIVKADRSTFGFLRLLTVPLLLVIDLTLLYTISFTQIIGIFTILCALGVLLYAHKGARKHAGLVIITSLISVITISLYKYDITNFNSVVAEQSIFYVIMLLFFGIMAKYRHNENVFRLLRNPQALLQSGSGGLAGVIENFAYLYAPASIILTMKRGLSILWSVLSGKKIFKETGIALKLTLLLLVAVALVLLVI